MANSWFQFKQFTVHQQFSAMKVTTDACLFGALLPNFEFPGTQRLLDIGTGTGLLSLMVAQKKPGAKILGVEIVEETAKEAIQNVNKSPFGKQIEIINMDIRTFEPGFKFDQIFSNPPFHENQLASPNEGKNRAHHHNTLTMETLLGLVAKWLLPSGTASLLLPFYREKEVIELGVLHGLFPSKIIQIKQTPHHKPFRSVIFFSQQKLDCHFSALTIKDEINQYTPDFTSLMQPFYLKL